MVATLTVRGFSFGARHLITIAAVDRGYREPRMRQGPPGYLVISDRALPGLPAAFCLHAVATGVAIRRRFTVLGPGACDAEATISDGLAGPEGGGRGSALRGPRRGPGLTDAEQVH